MDDTSSKTVSKRRVMLIIVMAQLRSNYANFKRCGGL